MQTTIAFKGHVFPISNISSIDISGGALWIQVHTKDGRTHETRYDDNPAMASDDHAAALAAIEEYEQARAGFPPAALTVREKGLSFSILDVLMVREITVVSVPTVIYVMRGDEPNIELSFKGESGREEAKAAAERALDMMAVRDALRLTGGAG